MELNKHYDAFREILDDQIKRIVKKGDITPQELDSVYKASAIILDMETEKAMKQEYPSEGSYASPHMGMRSHTYGEHDGHSTHYPWFMYYNDSHPDNMSHRGNSYGPIWNQEMENKAKHEHEASNTYDHTYDAAYDGSYDGAYDASNDGSYRRGRDARGRYTSRDMGYSRAMDRERMIGKLEDMMDDAPSEKERRALQQCVTKLEQQ